MNIFLVIALAMLLIIILLRRHIPIGPAILAGGLLIWALVAPQFHYLVSAFTTTLTMQRTYDLILALYFVMCLEIELRTSGALDGMIRALQRLFASEKFTLAIMPAFLGLLPSLGGARFSAPIVEAASRNTDLTKEHKAAINFWFRHIFEFSSPIIPRHDHGLQHRRRCLQRLYRPPVLADPAGICPGLAGAHPAAGYAR